MINAAKAVANRSGGPASGGGGGGGGGGSAAVVVGGKATVDGKPITTKIVKDGPNRGWKANVTAANGGGTVFGNTRLEVAQEAQKKAAANKVEKADRDTRSAAIKADYDKRTSETKWDTPEGGNPNVARWGKGHAPSHASGKSNTIRMKDDNGTVEVTRQKNGIRITSKVGGYESDQRYIQGTGTATVRAAFSVAKQMQVANASKDTKVARKENERAYGVRDQASAKNPAAAKYQGKIQKPSDVKTTRDGNLTITPRGYKPQTIGTIAKGDKGYVATVEGVSVTHKTRAGAISGIVRKIRA